ncbi:MAG: DUF6311 domain-containing protein [Acidimicrobiales bacterium]
MRFPPITPAEPCAPVAPGTTSPPARWPYAWAAVVAVAFAIRVLGWDFLSGRTEVVRLMAGDPAAGLAAFRIFVDDGWGWPLLETGGFGADGVNVAFSDSIPLLALVARLARPLGVEAETWWAVWFWLVYPLQAVAAVFAVRAWGARSVATQLAAPVLALLMPVLLRHSVHPSLSAHFVLLVAWGLAGRLALGPVATAADRHRFSVLAVLTLAIHPYLAVMVVALLAGSALDATTRGRLAPVVAARWLAVTLAVLGLWLWVGGYLGTVGSSDGGYGLYATHLSGPLRPVLSDLLPADPFGPDLDPALPAYSYLGAGLLVVCGTAIVTEVAQARRWVTGNQGLTLVLAVQWLWAVTPFVHYWDDDPIDLPTRLIGITGSGRTAGIVASLGGLVLAAGLVAGGEAVRRRGGPATLVIGSGAVAAAVSLMGLVVPGTVDAATEQFRASGRFTWPLLYAVPVLGLAALDRLRLERRPWLLPLTLAAVVALQVIDTGTLRRETRNILLPGGDVRAEHVAALVDLVSAHDRVHLGPDFRCTYYPDGVAAFIDVTHAASATARPIDRIYSARTGADVDCVVAQAVDLSDPAQITFFIEPVSLLDGGAAPPEVQASCRKRGTINVCTRRWDRMTPEVVAYFGPLDD